MPSTLESVLTALTAALTSATSATVKRNEPVPEVVPPGGLMILWDGEPGEPEVTLSPLTYHYQHTAELLVFAQKASPAARNTAFDTLKANVAAAVAADRTLGDLCDFVEAGAPAAEDLPVAGGKPIKSAIIPVVLHFATTDPLT